MSRRYEREETFRATPERLWRALTSSDELAAWVGPGSRMDPRPGGRWEIGAPGGAEILEIDPPRRLVVRWDVFGPDQPVTGIYSLEAVPEGTRLLIVEEGFSDNEPGLWAMGGSSVGWDGWLANLRGWIASGARCRESETGTLGARFGLRSLEGMGAGVYVRSLVSGGAAERADLRPQDDLLAWDGQPIVNSADFYRCYWATPPGRPVRLTVQRGGEQVVLTAVLAPMG